MAKEWQLAGFFSAVSAVSMRCSRTLSSLNSCVRVAGHGCRWLLSRKTRQT